MLDGSSPIGLMGKQMGGESVMWQLRETWRCWKRLKPRHAELGFRWGPLAPPDSDSTNPPKKLTEQTAADHLGPFADRKVHH